MARARSSGTAADGPVRDRHYGLQRAGDLRHRHARHRPSMAVAARDDHGFFHLWDVHRRRRRHPPQRPSLSRGARRIHDRRPPAVFRAVQPVCRALRRAVHGLVRLPQRARRLQKLAHAVDDSDGIPLYRRSDLRSAGGAVHHRADGERLAKGLSRNSDRRAEKVAVMSNGALIILMGILFLFFGYMGVPVAFALIASVLLITTFTPVSLASMIGQLFNGVDVEALMAVPFFLLVGDLMTSANVTVRMITLSQTLVGHFRGGLAQVVTLFSMFFAGLSGSSAADVAVLSRTLAPEMGREGYDKASTSALIASASTMANLIPPSIMAVVYGATGNVSIAGLFLGGVLPGVLVGIGLMIYSYFFGPVGFMKPRASFFEFAGAARDAAVPLVIPVIIMGGILTGWFTPTEAGLVAVVYILVVAIPALNWQHVSQLPLDFV